MKAIILAVGNTMKGDDGIGSYIVEQIRRYRYVADGELKDELNTSKIWEIVTIDCGTIPENYTSVIRKQRPDRLVLVDAAEMGLSSGSYRIINPEHMGVMAMSTHNMPLSLFVSYVSQLCPEVLLLGIQPNRMDLNEKLSPELYKAGDEVAMLIVKGRLSDIEIYHP
jgi:hydrogenase 3 maturation protease